MGRPKSWIANIDKIRKRLSEMEPMYPLGATDIMDLFQVRRSSAYDLIQLIGRAAEFDEPVTRAQFVLEYVRLSPEAQYYDREVQRKQRLAENLQKAEKDQVLRSHAIRATTADQWARLKDLPITFTSGHMTVEFGGFEDLIRTLYRFVNALRGPDWDEVKRLVERPNGNE